MNITPALQHVTQFVVRSPCGWCTGPRVRRIIHAWVQPYQLWAMDTIPWPQRQWS